MTFRDMMLTSAAAVAFAGMASAQDATQRYDFNELDVDGDGAVTEAELQAVIENVGSDHDPRGILEAQDTNGDGVLSREEAGADDAVYTMPDPADDDDDDDN